MLIDIKPFLDAIAPIAVQAIAGIVLALCGWVLHQIERWFHFQLTQQQWNVVKSAASTAAAKAFAGAEAAIVSKTITVTSPIVSRVINSAVGEIPEAIRRIGLTPEDAQTYMASLITAELGRLQATAMSPAAVPAN